MESLMMIRTRFILDWMNSSAKKYPHRLFEYQQQLLREGMFEAYHQWLFGSAQNLVSFQKMDPDASPGVQHIYNISTVEAV